MNKGSGGNKLKHVGPTFVLGSMQGDGVRLGTPAAAGAQRAPLAEASPEVFGSLGNLLSAHEVDGISQLQSLPSGCRGHEQLHLLKPWLNRGVVFVAQGDGGRVTAWRLAE